MSENDLTYAGGKLRLYVEAPLGAGASVAPDDGQTHYLLHVMRAKAGDRVSLFNGRDGEWLARIASISKRSCTLECERQIAPQAEVPDLWLCFAPIKKTPADYVVQKATELGVRVLQPVFTRRTIVSRVNLERMRANAIEASEQSERLSVPETREPLTFDKLLATWPAERRLIFCDEGGAPPLATALRDLQPGPTALFTGPEGGFDPSERDRLRAQPFVTPVSLGPRILRADTAALAALAVWQALSGDWV
ncbi:MAG TPA: 16S rRNA (uracil(1498)-N(3))-methyltransferase [Rhizomicrobium sp.]|jgi:16S rRNA (uracil1498-N3)-methyltransferase|nr:16S rRNA (uracil(1498)-N(3))-methyltransferase [Rhizomicrobium sp.]